MTKKKILTQLNHKVITRRDFVGAGLISGASWMIAPSVLDMIVNSSLAHAQVGSSNMPALITVDAVGGACFAWEVPPVQPDGVTPLVNMSRLGLGNNTSFISSTGTVTVNANTFDYSFQNGIAIANPAGTNTVGTMIPEIARELARNNLSPTTVLGQTCLVPIWSRSRDDSREVKNGIQTAVANAGLVGKIKLLGTSTSRTGIANEDAFALTPSTPFVPKSVDDVINALGSPSKATALGAMNRKRQGALMNMLLKINAAQAARMARAPASGADAKAAFSNGITQNQVLIQSEATSDPRKDATVAPIWGLTANSAPGSTDAVRASMVYAALKSDSGPVGIEMGGYDYHGQGIANQRTRHVNLGVLIGKILSTAAALNKPVFLYLITDGATDTAETNNINNQPAPRGDSGENGGNFIFMYNPGGVNLALKPNLKHVGWFDPNAQTVARGSVAENIFNGATSALMHYLAFAGLMTGSNPQGWLPILRSAMLNTGFSMSDADLQRLIIFNLS